MRLTRLSDIRDQFGPAVADALLGLGRHHTADDGEPYWPEDEADDVTQLALRGLRDGDGGGPTLGCDVGKSEPPDEVALAGGCDHDPSRWSGPGPAIGPRFVERQTSCEL